MCRPCLVVVWLAAIVLGLPAGLAGAEESFAADPRRPDERPREVAPAPSEAEAPALDVSLSEGGRDRRIPWDRLDGRAYAMVRDVVGGATLAREVRDLGFRSRKPVFDFLLANPDFAADVARALREGKYRLRRVGDEYEADDGRGARGRLVPVFAADGRHVFYLQGQYDPPLLPTLSGRLVIVLESEHFEGPDGIAYCDMRIAGYLKLDSALTEALVRVSQSFSEAQVDRRVRRFFRHVAAVSRRAYDDPEGLADELARRPDLPADRVSEFRRVLLAGLPPAWSETQQYHLLDSAALLDAPE